MSLQNIVAQNMQEQHLNVVFDKKHRSTILNQTNYSVVVIKLVTTDIATDKCELQSERKTTNLQYIAFREHTTLAIENKSEEK